jgi:hypothetical protein
MLTLDLRSQQTEPEPDPGVVSLEDEPTARFMVGCALVALWPVVHFLNSFGVHTHSTGEVPWFFLLGFVASLGSCWLTTKGVRRALPLEVFVPAVMYYAWMWVLQGSWVGSSQSGGMGGFDALIPGFLGLVMWLLVAAWALVGVIAGPWRFRLWAGLALAAFTTGCLQ